jgi:hypothetical protein
MLENRVLYSRSHFKLPSGTQKQGGTYRTVLSDMVVTPSSVRFENPGGNLTPPQPPTASIRNSQFVSGSRFSTDDGARAVRQPMEGTGSSSDSLLFSSDAYMEFH